jgi:membrane fusion protein, multidrug efflux system
VAQINLDYTEIRSPIDGRISAALVSPGNVVGTSSATMATIVSQDQMYVVFPVPMRRAIELREQYAGKLDFVDNKIALDTDTLLPVQSLRIRSSSHRQREASDFASS